MSRIATSFPSPFSALHLSLTTSFNHPSRSQTQSSMDSTTTSASSSPQSSLRGAAFTRSRTWTTGPRARSRSPRAMSSYTSSPVLLSRRPSSTDLALLEEESLAQTSKSVSHGLGLMEPRPVVPVAVFVPLAAGTFFDGHTEDEAEQRQPFVMSSISEVMEGK